MKLYIFNWVNLFISEDHNLDEMDEFMSEITIMKSISRHPNIVALIGYCTAQQPMLMVMEYVGCGDLVSLLYIFMNCWIQVVSYMSFLIYSS